MTRCFPLAGIVVFGLAAACSRTPQSREAAYLKSAAKHLQSNDLARAILDFKNAAQVMPQDSEPHYRMGLAYSNAGNLQDGVAEFQKSIDLNPRHSAALVRLAEIMIASNNLEQVKAGEEKARQALAFSPDNADAWQVLAAGELREGDRKSAAGHLETALQKSPGHLKSASMLAAIKMQDKDLDGAEATLKQAAGAQPNSAEHRMALGRFYAQTDRLDEAKQEFEQALKIDPKYGRALVVLADLSFRDGKMEQAAQFLQRASALPDRAYRPLHAAFLLENGKGDEAVTEFERLYKQDRADRDLRTRLISAYLRTGRNAAADKILVPALKKDPNDSTALLQRGELYLAMGKYPEAVNDVNSVLRLRPDSSEAHLLLARIHQARNDSAGHLRELSEALRVNPGLMAARIELAHSMILANSLQMAIEVLDGAPQEQRANPALIVERNTALYAMEDYAEMRKGVNRGLAAAPQDPDLLLQDGLLRFKENDVAGGRASLEQALKWRSEEWRALEALAMSYVAEHNIAEANAVVREYTSRVPNSIAAQQFLAGWLSRTGDRIGARLAFESARAMAPPGSKTAEAADRRLAELDLRDSNVDSARRRLLPLLKGEPGDLSVILDLAVTEYGAGHWADATSYYEKALQLNPASLAALNNLAFLLADTQRDPDRALALAQRAKQIAPNDPTINDTLGWAYYSKGQFAMAVKTMSLNKATTPKWKCHLAMAYAKTGDREQAGALLQAALKQDPKLPEAKRVRAMLEAK